MLMSLVNVTIGGLIVGAGLPLFFALGIRFLVPHENRSAQQVSGGQKILGYICFAIPIIAVLAGILWLGSDRMYSILGIDLFGASGRA